MGLEGTAGGMRSNALLAHCFLLISTAPTFTRIDNGYPGAKPTKLQNQARGYFTRPSIPNQNQQNYKTCNAANTRCGTSTDGECCIPPKESRRMPACVAAATFALQGDERESAFAWSSCQRLFSFVSVWQTVALSAPAFFATKVHGVLIDG